MTATPELPSMRAISVWRCPRCGGDCREQSLRLPVDGEPTMNFLACVGMNCDLVFGTGRGRWLGYQVEGRFVPASPAELERVRP